MVRRRGVAECPIRPFLDSWGLFCTVQLFYRQFCALFSFFCLFRCFPLTRRLNWIRFFVFYHVLHLIFCCIWLRLCVPQLALSSCTQIQRDEPAPQCFFLFFVFWSNLQSSLTGIRCQHISPRWVKVQQCLQVHQRPPLLPTFPRTGRSDWVSSITAQISLSPFEVRFTVLITYITVVSNFAHHRMYLYMKVM